MALINYTNECGQLKKIALYRPSINEIYQGDPKDVMYISKPKPSKVIEEFDGIVEKFRDLGVEVVVLENDKRSLANCPNMIFLRDVAVVIQDKIVLANMKYSIRKAEPEKFHQLLVKENAEYSKSVINLLSDETMEGADILVLSPHKIFAHTGYRTEAKAIHKISEVLNLDSLNISANTHDIPQHLLGGMHILTPELIARRPATYNTNIDDYGYIDFDETSEIASGFAMNIVTISPGVVLMPANYLETQKKLEKSGITCHVVDINEIHKMGGGLACMTLPLKRDAI